MADEPRGWRMTPADLVFLDALARHGTLTYGQLERFFYNSPRTVSHRLTRMQAAGLVTIDRTAQTILGRVVQPTTRGLRAVGSPLSVPKPVGESVAAFSHDVVATELLLELEAAGLSVVTGREINHYERGDEDERVRFAREKGFQYVWKDARGEMRFFTVPLPVQKGDRPDRVRLRFPDGAYRFEDGTAVALEVERTPKNRDRTREILAAYAPEVITNKLTGEKTYRSPFQHCHWLVTPPVERMLAGKDGLLFERRKGSLARCADPDRPETWKTFEGRDKRLVTLGVNVVEPMVAVDDGADFSLARFDSKVATKDMTRAEWIAARTDRPRWTSPLLFEPEPTPA